MSRECLYGVVVLLAVVAVGVAGPAIADPPEQHNGRPGVYPADFAMTLDQQGARKFTANDIRSFVYHVFSMYERATSSTRRVGPEAFRLLVDDNVRIDFPDYKIANWSQFVEWHKWIHQRLVGDDHVLGPIEVKFMSDGSYQVRFVVVWRALFKTGEYTEARIEQTWRLREQEDRDLPVIETYVAKSADSRVPD